MILLNFFSLPLILQRNLKERNLHKAHNSIWAGDAIVDTLTATVTIPASLAPGDYLIRHELIALHQANNPQCMRPIFFFFFSFLAFLHFFFLLDSHSLSTTIQSQTMYSPVLTLAPVYPECAQFTVTGSGTASPSGSYLGSFPGIYTGTEPGVAFNIDSDAAKTSTSYPIPGLPVWDGTGSGSGSGSGGGSPAPTDPTTTAAPATTMTTVVTAVPTSSPPSCQPVAKYGQCGGKTYTGCTVCVAGSKCSASGEYYSQCL